MKYPTLRMRRLRENPSLRRMLSESRLSAKNLVQPLFVKEGLSSPAAIASMPGQRQETLKSLADRCRRVESSGVPAVILFGIPSKKDTRGAQAFAKSGIIQKAVAAVKKASPKLLVITDLCLCEYMSHGHCGHVRNGRVLNDATLSTLAKAAVSQARAGSDVIAPSDMMDGRVAAIRQALDRARFESLPILSYAVKYASAFYSPFREAAESAPGFGDRSSYQMNPANAREAVREASLDLAEGADMLLVKPAFSYQDVLVTLRKKFDCPIGAYSVSGEYAMIKAASQKGWLDEKKAVLEMHLGLRRAGADFIMTYWATEIASWLKKEN